MPVLQIQSLPFKRNISIEQLLADVTADFSTATGVAPEHITITWEFFQPGHYTVNGIASDFQPKQSHPILVDLLVPDFNHYDTIRLMIETVAESLATRIGIPSSTLFINCRLARSGMIFDNGKIVSWNDL